MGWSNCEAEGPAWGRKGGVCSEGLGRGGSEAADLVCGKAMGKWGMSWVWCKPREEEEEGPDACERGKVWGSISCRDEEGIADVGGVRLRISCSVKGDALWDDGACDARVEKGRIF